MGNNKTYVYLSLALALILSGLTWFYGVFNFFGIIIDQFHPLMKQLAIFFTGVLNLICLFTAFRELFIKRISKKSLYIILGVVAVLVIFNVVDVIYYADFFFTNSTNVFKMIYFFFWNICYIGLFIFTYIQLKNGKIGDATYEPLLKGYFPRLEEKIGRRVGYGIYYVFASYFLGDFLLAIFRWGNYYLEPFWYVFFLLFILSPVINLVFSIKKEHNFISAVIGLSLSGLNILFIVLYVVVAKTNYYAIQNVAQNLFFIDFATSYPIGPIIIIIELTVSTVLHLIHGIKILSSKAVAEKA